MRLEEWVDITKKELEGEGFKVSMFDGFPLVEIPKTLADGKRLLMLELQYGGCKTLYAEGCLVTPISPL